MAPGHAPVCVFAAELQAILRARFHPAPEAVFVCFAIVGLGRRCGCGAVAVDLAQAVQEAGDVDAAALLAAFGAPMCCGAGFAGGPWASRLWC